MTQVLELQHQHQSFQWIFRLISFRIDWFDLLAIQGILKSLLQHHSLKHQFFGTQPSLLTNSHIHTWLLGKKKKKNYSLYKKYSGPNKPSNIWGPQEEHHCVRNREGGEEKRKGKLDLLAMICMRGMLRVLDLIFHPNRRPWKLWKGNNMAISIVERERKKRLASGTQIRNWWHASNKRISWQR